MTVDEQNTDLAIPELRRRFEEEYADNIANGLYDTRDITRLQTDDAYAGCFIRHGRNDVTAAVSLAHTSLRWRKEMEVNDLSETSFPRWVHNLSAMYYHNVDKQGHPILISHVAKCKKDAEKHHLQKQYIAWIFEKHFIRHPDERVAMCFDMSGAGISNMDIELIKFQVTCFTTYYPSFLAYMLVFDMPWILNTIWRVIRTLLNEAQQKAVIFVKGDEILRYIDRDQLLKSMGGTDTFEYKYLPTEMSLLSIADSDSGDVASTPDGDGPSSGTKKKVTFAQDEDTVTFEAADKSRKSRLRRQRKDPRRQGDANIFHSPLLTISPAEEFVFELTDEQKEAVDVLTLFNCTEKLVAYKVKTTSPASYRVRPSSGLIKTQTSADINIVLLRGCHLTANEDRFLLMAMTVNEDITPASPRLKELWQEKTQEGDTNYMEHRLGSTVLLCGAVDADTVDGDAEDDRSLGWKMSQLIIHVNSVLQTQRELASKLQWLLVINILLLFLIIILLPSAAIYWWAWSTTQLRSDGHVCQATSPFK